jgi:CRP/FNR family transcriptional regulator, cyclic AMP receptor protein
MTNLDDRVELLRHAWLFSGCSDDELSRIAGLATPRTAATGDTMCVEGEPGDDFFVIVEGSATASVGGTKVGDLDAGSFFGEMALIDGGDRTATVTATTSMQLLVLSRNDFNAMLSTAMPAVAPKLLEVIGQRMRDLQAQAGAPLAY